MIQKIKKLFPSMNNQPSTLKQSKQKIIFFNQPSSINYGSTKTKKLF